MIYDQNEDYQYDGAYNFRNRKQAIKRLHDLRNDLGKSYRESTKISAELKDLFQQEEKGLPPANGYWPNGFELEFYVPEEYFLFMGDNRDESEDSRGGLGLIPFENIIGKAVVKNF